MRQMCTTLITDTNFVLNWANTAEKKKVPEDKKKKGGGAAMTFTTYKLTGQGVTGSDDQNAAPRVQRWLALPRRMRMTLASMPDAALLLRMSSESFDCVMRIIPMLRLVAVSDCRSPSPLWDKQQWRRLERSLCVKIFVFECEKVTFVALKYLTLCYKNTHTLVCLFVCFFLEGF